MLFRPRYRPGVRLFAPEGVGGLVLDLGSRETEVFQHVIAKLGKMLSTLRALSPSAQPGSHAFDQACDHLAEVAQRRYGPQSPDIAIDRQACRRRGPLARTMQRARKGTALERVEDEIERCRGGSALAAGGRKARPPAEGPQSVAHGEVRSGARTERPRLRSSLRGYRRTAGDRHAKNLESGGNREASPF